MAETVVELTGCTLEEAHKALQVHGDEIWKAVDSLMTKPEVSGDKYLPKKPVINNGLTAEQYERCLKGRNLQDRVNAVFSVAHAQHQTQPVPSALEAQPAEDSSAGPKTAADSS